MDSHLIVVAVFVLGILVGLPVAFVLLIAAFAGLVALRGLPVAMTALSHMPYGKVTDLALMTIPLFILMGAFATQAGVSARAYQMANRFVGHLRGGLAMATVFACAAFAATSGSSVATSAAVGRIALKEMRRFGYDRSVSAGTIASAGLLGIMIPPSIMLVVYGIITQTDIGQLLVAGVLPGILTGLVFSVGLYLLARLRPDLMPTADQRFSWRQRVSGLRDGWGVAVLFGVIVGGIYSGLFTVTEAAAVGAVAAFLMVLARQGFQWRELLTSGREAAGSCAMIFLILIGAGLLSQYIALSGLGRLLGGIVADSSLPAWVILAIILAAYIPLGMFLEPISLCLITLPIVFPTVTALGYDPVWFGIIVVKMSELANITPPLGVNVFVIKAVDPEMPISAVFRGAGFFVLLELVTLALLVALPEISLLLPQLMLG